MDWWCASPVEVILNGTFLYFVDELRLVRHTEVTNRQSFGDSVPPYDVIEA